MKNIIYTLLLMTLLTGLSSNVYAAKDIEITGQGLRGCGDWIADKKSNSYMKRFNEVWILGFLSGRATLAGSDIVRGVPDESLFLWIDNYCNKYPLHNVAGAGAMLFNELKKQKGLK